MCFTAWIGSLGPALIYFIGPLSGILINHLGCRATALVGAVTCAISLVFTSFSNSLEVMYFSYSVLFGLGASLVFASGLVIVAKYFTKRRALATGIVGSGHALGVMILGPILEILFSRFGWRNTYRMMAGVVFVICFLACLYDPHIENNCPAVTSKETDPSSIQDTERNPLLEKTMDKGLLLDMTVWKNPAFIKITLLATVIDFGRYSPGLHLVI